MLFSNATSTDRRQCGWGKKRSLNGWICGVDVMLIYASPPIPSGREGGNLCLLVWSRFGHQPPVSVSQEGNDFWEVLWFWSAADSSVTTTRFRLTPKAKNETTPFIFRSQHLTSLLLLCLRRAFESPLSLPLVLFYICLQARTLSMKTSREMIYVRCSYAAQMQLIQNRIRLLRWLLRTAFKKFFFIKLKETFKFPFNN